MARSKLSPLCGMLLAAAACLGVITQSATPVLACSPGRVNDGRYYYVDWVQAIRAEPGPVNGASGQLDVRAPTILSYYTEYKVKMDDGTRFAEFGWVETSDLPGTARAQVSWECGSSECSTYLTGSLPINTNHEFKMTYDAVSTVRYWYDGLQVASESVGYRMYTPKVLAAIATLANQMPGNTSWPAAVNNPYYLTQYNGWFQFANPIADNPYNAYFGQTTASGTMTNGTVWDKYCSS
jgi:hypothetical protein